MKNKFIMAAAAFLLLPFSFLHAQLRLDMSEGSPMVKLITAERYINDLYVDSVDEQRLVEDAIRGMLEKLDPHSTYSTAKEAKAMNEQLEGSFDGIGVQFNIVDDTLMVIQTISGGPSYKVGVLAGDRIVSCNDTTIAGVKMTQDEIKRRLRGPRGSQVRLGIKREGVAEIVYFDVIRDKIPVNTIDSYYMIRPGIGYIRINSIGATTYREMMQALVQLRSQGMNDLVLDLCENGGGYLQAAVQIANEFLAKGDLIVYTKGRRVDPMEFHADGRGIIQSGKVVVVVDEYTASAAEIITGALQDQDRGTVVGRRTFGKGLVQRPVTLRDGSMIKLTVSHYYTPAGRCIQKPYVKGKAEDYQRDVLNRLHHGELTNPDSIRFADSLRVETLRKHRTIYGGGGIMPDIFVPLDTTRYTPYHRMLSAKGVIVKQNLRFVDQHRKELLAQYPDFESYNAQFCVPESLLTAIFEAGEKEKVTPKDDEERAKTVTYLSQQMKALIARDLWTMNEYYRVMNEQNPMIQRALQEF